ncbi:MAG TPA: sugar phosphate isomerase/epimerase, partial [Candidatus Brocadiia bacterium]|nr:sugar phosphate isomerase/epimerase [Candidatus Brocadiia bacterium]
MSDTVIAAQLYTVREFCKTPADFAKSMAKVSEIGYEAVQISGVGPMAAAEMRRICDGEGLKICATHVGFEALLNETAAQIDFHKTLGCENVAIGGLPASYRENGAGFLRFAKEATEVGRRLAAAGLTFSYHNHSFELEKFDGRLALDIIYEESDPGL